MSTPVADFYSAQSRRFGPSGILDHHRERANRIDVELNGRRKGRVLELGAGAGGTAAATAELGYEVTAIELSPVRAQFARELASLTKSSPRIVEGDFYLADLGSDYELVSYWNGFGMNEDVDQRRLLRRVALEWLEPGGLMVLDIYNPSWWAKLPAEVKLHDDYRACQRTTFDDLKCRFVDCWWPIDDEQEAVEQSIRCYSPVDLELLLEGTGMRLESIDATGSLTESYSYRAVLRQSTQ